MAIQKITGDVIATSAVTADSLADTTITAAKLHTTLDLTGKTVTVATASAGDNDTTVASTAFVSTAVSNLVDSSPDALNTLNELANALGDDANFSTTVTNSIATKLPLAGGTMTGNIVMGDNNITGINKLEILDSADNNRLEIYGNASNGFIFDMGGTGSTGTINFNDFNVGIGTTSPSDKLEIGTTTTGGNMRVVSSSYANNGLLRFFGTDNVERLQMGALSGTAAYIYTPASTDLVTYTGGTEKMRITSAGIVDIGKVSFSSYPTGAKLNVYGDGEGFRLDGTGATSRSIRFRNVGTNGTSNAIIVSDGSLQLKNEDANAAMYFNSVRDMEFQVTSGNGTAGNMTFLSYNTEIMRIDGANNRVGIGTTSPDSQLHIHNPSTDWGQYSTITLSSDVEGTNNAELKYYRGADASTESFQIALRGTTRATIDSSGNLLVGKTATTLSLAGTYITATGSVGVTRASDDCLTLNRTGNDGAIASFYKDGSPVGSIDNVGTVLKFKSSNNLHLEQNGNSVTRSLNLTGTAFKPFDSNDNQLDLGTSSARFKKLYLSSGAYVYEVQTQTVGLGSVVAGASVGTTYSDPVGVFWHNGGGMTDYSIHRTAGAWSGNYQQLKLDWDTGIILDGGTAYGKSGVHIHGNISMGDSTYSNFTSPNYPVHICADNYGLMIESGTGYGHLGSNNTSYFHFGGNRTFYFDNRCEANGGFHTYSDENLKKEITVIPSALNKVAQMNGVTFKWKDAAKRGGGDSGKQFGVTAQNMLAVDSELPTKNIDPLYNIEDGVSADDEYYTMDYTRITPFLIEAVKELKTKLEAAEARIATLEG